MKVRPTPDEVAGPWIQQLGKGRVGLPTRDRARETFDVAPIEAPAVLVHTSQRGRTVVSWAAGLRERLS